MLKQRGVSIAIIFCLFACTMRVDEQAHEDTSYLLQFMPALIAQQEDLTVLQQLSAPGTYADKK